MQYVGDRFGMHPAMFDNHLLHVSRNCVPDFIDCRPSAGHIRLHGFQSRPVSGGVLRSLARWRIDACLKQRVERRIERRLPEHSARELIPVERFQVPNIKDKSMPSWNWPLVECVARNHPK